MKKINEKENTTKLTDTHSEFIGSKIQHSKKVKFPKLIYRFNTIFTKIPVELYMYS